jgi:hypothetical protein
MSLAYPAIQIHVQTGNVFYIFMCTALSYMFIFKTSEKSLLFSHGLFTLLRIQLLQYDNDSPVAAFIVPDRGDKVGSGIGLSYRQYKGWQAVMTTLCRSQLYPPFRDYAFGYSSFVHSPQSPILHPSPFPRPQPQKNKLLRGPETHTKR